MKMTIKTGDNVIVITGKDKGKSGKVTKVYADEGRVLVEGVNIVSRHQKPRSQEDKGGIIKKNAPIDASNVQVVCPVCGKATRVAHTEINGKKVRVCKKCKGSLDKEFVKQTKKEAKKTIKANDLKGAKLKAAQKPAEENVAEEKPVAKKAAAKTTTAKKTTAAKTSTKSTTKPAAEKTAKQTATKATTTKTAEKKTTTKKSTAKKEEK